MQQAHHGYKSAVYRNGKAPRKFDSVGKIRWCS
nr:MAG TPA: hypothetical protein [Caudoviricetes sp.]